MGKNNRQRVQDTKDSSAKSRYAEKVVSLQPSNDWKLDWFTNTEKQQHLVNSMLENDLSIGDGPSGCGKTSSVICQALKLYRDRRYNKIIFIKNPTEAGDDLIGYLKGEAEDKLKAHFHETRNIFTNFISKGKLESDESRGGIQFKIPAFLLGATLDDAIIIIDEAQTMSPGTVKLLLERTGQNSIVVLLGDSKQRYSVKKRADGFADFISKVTDADGDGNLMSNQDLIGYTKLTTDDNRRSDLSKLITEIYA